MIDGSLETIDGRPALRFERRLAHSVERVWCAVTDPVELAEWFVVPVPWTPLLGERFESYGQAGEITQLRPPRLIGWTWGTESYRFELRPDVGGCVLVFTHVLDESRGSAAQHAAGWAGYLDRLEARLGGRVLSEEDAHGPIGERHERYARRFGLDPAAGRRTIAAMAFRGLTLRGRPGPAAGAPLLARPRARMARARRPRRARRLVPLRRGAGGHRERPPDPPRGALVRRPAALRARRRRRRLPARLHARLRRPRHRRSHGRRLGSLLRARGRRARGRGAGRGRVAARVAGGPRSLRRQRSASTPNSVAAPTRSTR